MYIFDDSSSSSSNRNSIQENHTVWIELSSFLSICASIFAKKKKITVMQLTANRSVNARTNHQHYSFCCWCFVFAGRLYSKMKINMHTYTHTLIQLTMMIRHLALIDPLVFNRFCLCFHIWCNHFSCSFKIWIFQWNFNVLCFDLLFLFRLFVFFFFCHVVRCLLKRLELYLSINVIVNIDATDSIWMILFVPKSIPESHVYIGYYCGFCQK